MSKGVKKHGVKSDSCSRIFCSEPDAHLGYSDTCVGTIR